MGTTAPQTSQPDQNSEGEVTEISLEEGLGEGIDQPRPAPGSSAAMDAAESTGAIPTEEDISEREANKKQANDDLEALAPKIATKEWTFGAEGASRTYYQSQLSVLGKAQFFGLLGNILDDALSGKNALSLNSLLAPPAPRQPGQYQIQDFQDADTFVHALGKLMGFSPKFIHESVCIWLSVPDYEWDLMKMLMGESPDNGGMSDDDFEEILSIFIDQNYTAIDSFFRQRSQRLRARFLARQKEASQSRSSKP